VQRQRTAELEGKAEELVSDLARAVCKASRSCQCVSAKSKFRTRTVPIIVCHRLAALTPQRAVGPRDGGAGGA
jgi:hypothetical protein